MNMQKNISIILISTILILGLGGCMNLTSRGTSSDDMIKFMNNKYGETFTYIEPYGGQLGSKTKQILVSCNKYPGEKILVAGTQLENGKLQYSDNYTAFLLKDRVKTLLEDIVSRTYGSNCKVLYDISDTLLPSNFNQNTALKEYTSSGSSLIAFTVLLPNGVDVNKKDFDIEVLRKNLKENLVIANGNIYYVNNDSVLNEINNSNEYTYIQKSDWYKSRGHFSLNTSYEFSSVNMNW